MAADQHDHIVEGRGLTVRCVGLPGADLGKQDIPDVVVELKLLDFFSWAEEAMLVSVGRVGPRWRRSM